MITATPVETLHNYRSWNIACLDTDTTTSFAHGFGVAPDFYKIVSGLSMGGAGGGVAIGSAGAYGVLAGSGITSTGPTVINGNLGLSPGSSVTGAPTVTGQTNIDNPAAVTAQSDLTAAYVAAAALTPATTIATQLAGQTLGPGVYSSLAGTFAISAAGTVILDAGGNPNAVFVFQMATTLITGAGSVVSLINGAQAGNVIWQVGSSATLGTTTAFQGTILALTSITLNTGATVNGRMLARNGAVTLDSNTITIPSSGGFGGAISTWGMTVNATNVTLTKQNSPGSGGGAPGVSVVAKAWCWRPQTAAR